MSTKDNAVVSHVTNIDMSSLIQYDTGTALSTTAIVLHLSDMTAIQVHKLSH